MSDPRAERERCRFCGTTLTRPAAGPIGGSAADSHPGDGFCSPGCRGVYDELGAPSERPKSSDRSEPIEAANSAAGSSERAENGLVRAFFRVDGMHSASCEAFLESVASSQAGVRDATASYVTETVRVDHDPETVSESTLRDAISGVGYTAYLRSDAAAESELGEAETGTTRRSREMSGLRKRRSEDMLEVRYIVGIVFGTFLLVPFIAILYPVYLSSFTDWWVLSLYEGAFDTFDGMLFVRLFTVLTGVVLYLTGMPVLRGAYISLKLRRPNTHLLVALTVVSAYIYGTLAVLLGSNDVYYDLTIVVAAAVMAAVYYESTVKRRAMNRLTELTISQVDHARRLEADGPSEVPVDALEAGDRVLVREGERIPVDGVLIESACTVDESVVTGESLPVSKAPGEGVLGGSVVTNDAAIVRVGEETTSSIDRLTRAVWNVQSAAHGLQRRADELADTCVPLVIGSAVIVGVALVILGAGTADAAMGALLTVIVASPWAIGLATPLSVASSITDAMERGIVVFDETVFERLRAVDIVVFDKTGTLTTGNMTVLEADAPEDVLAAAGFVERRASHPAADAIASAFAVESNESADPLERSDGQRDDRRVQDFQTHDGGVEGVVDGKRILVGHPDLFREQGWKLDEAIESRVADARGFGRLPVAVGVDGRAAGVLVVGDEPRAEWDETVTKLRNDGVDVVVLTGDDEGATDFFDRHEGVDGVFADVPPTGKTATIRRLQETDRVAMVGDGTNDAPALAQADLGISMGSGTALASDASDLAIVDDDLTSVEQAFALSNATRRRVRQNLGLAFVYNAAVIPLAVIGALNPLFATAAVAVTGLLILANSSRSPPME
ncbi:heavy-metal transporting CPx-type ATPase [Halostagnicola larsenii XH-48]|uniref:Heavy-metal transporting CPx-type ATPase n=1 Tax=Halostagnicola larsenii XH-48 TaxID=797299 RepID=W0JNY3_9EURY|nr:cation-translocating P-type ATPase [Halostagnicola larsenii]AHF99011.1 heavy-metal transporting CPx-type ATPase [Halostagnicola larsenii XH-48]